MASDEKSADAEMNPWLVVDVDGEPSLFGFALRHPNTGGLSWVLSTRIVELDEATGRARTESGRVYTLGRRIRRDELDEEGRLALRLLLAKWTEMEAPPGNDLRWLTARKMSRHLGVESPRRDDPAAVEEFLATYHELYALRRAGRRPN